LAKKESKVLGKEKKHKKVTLPPTRNKRHLGRRPSPSFILVRCVAFEIIRMKGIIFILTALVTLSSCDPFYTGELRNYTNEEIEVTVCGSDLFDVNANKTSRETMSSKEPKNCKTIVVAKGGALPLVVASEIAKPITSNDLGFDEITIKTQKGQIHALGKDLIICLFKIEKHRNFIGINTHDVYHFDVGKNEEE
jgi:hypothetical protein